MGARGGAVKGTHMALYTVNIIGLLCVLMQMTSPPPFFFLKENLLYRNVHYSDCTCVFLIVPLHF